VKKDKDKKDKTCPGCGNSGVRERLCPSCEGTGVLEDGEFCVDCEGAGFTYEYCFCQKRHINEDDERG
jgi:hypothetical protein